MREILQAALMAGLAPKTSIENTMSHFLGFQLRIYAKVLRDSRWHSNHCLPVTKSPGDEVFSGSTCKQGEIEEAVVIASGINTKTTHLVNSTHSEVLSVTMAIGSHRLSQQGAFTKRMTAIEEMAGMLTLNKLTVREQEVHFLPVNPVDKRTTITYLDSNGNWHRVGKGALDR
ncbi:Hypothetical predicted protein [Olea europaea subsp. europaea]|uniref:Uncharacterized protein n=1 Tax=Olea europaea subsp. europaea TaxID=158383 RepID=A0A8S0SR67_OLEEU|nr:Hypothetical predicted protein [Olea europaea subsp. europaea]